MRLIPSIGSYVFISLWGDIDIDYNPADGHTVRCLSELGDREEYDAYSAMVF